MRCLVQTELQHCIWYQKLLILVPEMTGIYLLFVGSRRVDVWRDKFKDYKKIDIAGKQLERSMFEKLKRKINCCLNNDAQ